MTEAAARVYNDHAVPAMFAPLARATLDRIALPNAARVLDVACGTGALTREIAARLRGGGRLVGADISAAMLRIARACQTGQGHPAEFFEADATDLPFGDGQFDLVFCQQGLQFFPDKTAALAEFRRVLATDGRLVLTCWSGVPVFSRALVDALLRHVDQRAAEVARAPFTFCDGTVIADLIEGAEFTIRSHEILVLQRHVDDLHAQIMGLPVESHLRQAGVDATNAVVRDVAEELGKYMKNGTYILPQSAHVFEAWR